MIQEGDKLVPLSKEFKGGQSGIILINNIGEHYKNEVGGEVIALRAGQTSQPSEQVAAFFISKDHLTNQPSIND